MAPTIVLVSPADTQPEERLKVLGRRYATLPISALQRFTQPGADAPGILLVDVREHRDGFSHLRAIRHMHPQTGLVIIAPLDPALMLEAMRAGITECVPAPIDAGSSTPRSRVFLHRHHLSQASSLPSSAQKAASARRRSR
jgi:hypothetical protein